MKGLMKLILYLYTVIHGFGAINTSIRAYTKRTHPEYPHFLMGCSCYIPYGIYTAIISICALRANLTYKTLKILTRCGILRFILGFLFSLLFVYLTSLGTTAFEGKIAFIPWSAEVEVIFLSVDAIIYMATVTYPMLTMLTKSTKKKG